MPIGDEWILPAEHSLEMLTDCVEAVCRAWPDAVVQDTAACEFAYSVDSLLPGEDSELCVYRDFEVAREWQMGGAGDQLHNSMIQAALIQSGVRLIADDWQDPQLGSVAAHVREWHAEGGSSHQGEHGGEQIATER